MTLTKQERKIRRGIKLLLYKLERTYGVAADFYKVTKGEPDYQNGKTNVTLAKYSIPRLVTHDVSFSQKFEYDLSFLAANKNFTYGGIYVPGDRLVILNGSAIPSDVEVSTEDYIMYGNKRYSIQRIDQLDYRSGWIMHLRHTPGVKSNQVHDRTVWSRVTTLQDIESEL